jgi:predicted MFS family arabinose efflux permease
VTNPPQSSFYNDVRSFWRYLALGIGLVVGSLVSGALCSAADLGRGRAAALLLAVAALMLIVALFAAFGPARPSLRIPAIEALRMDP